MMQESAFFMRTRKAELTSAPFSFIPWARSKQIIKGCVQKLQERERSRACRSQQVLALIPSGQVGLPGQRPHWLPCLGAGIPSLSRARIWLRPSGSKFSLALHSSEDKTSLPVGDVLSSVCWLSPPCQFSLTTLHLHPSPITLRAGCMSSILFLGITSLSVFFLHHSSYLP